MTKTRSVRSAREAFNAAWKAYNQAVVAEPFDDKLTPAQQAAWLVLVEKQHDLYAALRAAGGSPLRDSDRPIRSAHPQRSERESPAGSGRSGAHGGTGR